MQFYRVTARKWRQIWVWFEGNFKRFRVKAEFLAVLFDLISKQQSNSSLLLSGWYCQKLGLTNLPGRNGRVTSDKGMVLNSHQGHKDENRDYCSHFSVIFKTTKKFLIVFVRLILGKKGIDGVTRPQREIDIRYEFNLKVVWRRLGFK